MKTKYMNHSFWVLVCILLLGACKEDEYALPQPDSGLQNDALKRKPELRSQLGSDGSSDPRGI